MAEPDTQNSPETASGVTTLSTLPDVLLELASLSAAIKSNAASLAEIKSTFETVKRSISRREKQLSELAAELGESEEAVFDRAIAFFKDALEAERRGDRVVIANKDYDILTELSGFGPVATSSR